MLIEPSLVAPAPLVSEETRDYHQIMPKLSQTLGEFDFFSGLEPKTLSRIGKLGKRYAIPGGSVLYRAGEASDRVFFVLSGRLIVVRTTLGDDAIVGYVRAGEPVGEMALLLDEPHAATVYALRDSEILEIDHEAFDMLLENHGDLASRLARAVLRRSRKPVDVFAKSLPKVFALIATSPAVDIEYFCRSLTRSIERLGKPVGRLNENDLDNATSVFETWEREGRIILLSARVADTPWYRFVLRHADRFLVFARRDVRPPRPFPLSPDDYSPARRFRLVDFVAIEEGITACPVMDWIREIDAQRVFRWQGADAAGHLARVIAGRSVGLVLSGGGARAYAHIGAMRALRQSGVPIDFAAGASMGGIIAACVAAGWDDDEVDFRIQEAFVKSNPLSDFRLPVIALTRGNIVDERLRAHFGDARIEELKIPFFCVSSDLTSGDALVHRTGLLRDALRASISLPGILPPVVDGEKLLVDGGLINNFPTDIMAAMHRGVTIGIDVARKGSIDARDYLDAPGFLGWVRQHGFRAPPPIVGLLMRAATTRRESTLVHHPADIMITPAVTGIDLRSWKHYEQAVTDGYDTTMRALDHNRDTVEFITTLD